MHCVHANRIQSLERLPYTFGTIKEVAENLTPVIPFADHPLVVGEVSIGDQRPLDGSLAGPQTGVNVPGGSGLLDLVLPDGHQHQKSQNDIDQQDQDGYPEAQVPQVMETIYCEGPD